MKISETLQNELRSKYSPEGSDLRRAQIRMTEMLTFFDTFCKKHSLIYWLDAGTLLGAVRHGGFIPWDDDTDVMMPKKDYERFKKIMLSMAEHDEFVLQCHETDPGYFGAWMVLRDKTTEYIQDSNLHRARKYRGLQIDIIACENHFIPLLYRFCALYQNHLIDRPLQNNCEFHTIPWRVKLAYFIFQNLLIPFFHWISMIVPHNYVKYYYGAYWNSRRYLKNIFPVGRIVFEGVELSAPCNPEGYLSDEFGQWQDIPSMDKIQTHNVKFVFNNKV